MLYIFFSFFIYLFFSIINIYRASFSNEMYFWELFVLSLGFWIWGEMQRSQMYFHADVILVAVYISSQNQEKSTYISFFSQSIFTEFHNAEIITFTENF